MENGLQRFYTGDALPIFSTRYTARCQQCIHTILMRLLNRVHKTARPSILPPPVRTFHALRPSANNEAASTTGNTHSKEGRHGLVGATNLQLVEGRLLAMAIVLLARRPHLLRVLPRPRPTEDVFLLDSVVFAPREYGIRNRELIWTGAAFETVAVVLVHRDGEEIGARRADCPLCELLLRLDFQAW
jgi:hypothetical protein